MSVSVRRRTLFFAFALFSIFPAIAVAQTINVATEAELRTALTTAPAGAVIVFNADVTLTGELPSVSTDVTIDGSGHTLSGNNQYRGLVVAAFGGAAPAAVNVAIQNLTIANTVATGGMGGDGIASGGGGLGGAIFVADQATVTLTNVGVSSSSAIGGDGAAVVAVANGGGGGGMGGDGGANGGGGGGFGLGATGGAGVGSAGIITGASSGGTSGTAAAGGADGGGGGGAGGGGVAGGVGISGFGGNGGYGGGDAAGSGGSGGFGGGGAGGSLIAGGAGGYGGGGGGTTAGGIAAGGFGAGAGANGAGGAGGGGGAGLGGAIFVEGGGSLTVNGALTVNGSSVTGGLGASGGGNGGAFGAGVFLGGFGAITFAPGAGTTTTVADQIADEFGAAGGAGSWSLAKNGAGTLVLSSANTYAGGTTVNDGTLSVASQSNLGLGNLVLQNASTLWITASNTFTSDASIYNTPTINVASGQTATWNGQMADDGAGTILGVTGGGTLVLANATNDWLGGTVVTGGSTVAVTADGALGNAAGGLTLGDASTSGTLTLTGANTYTGGTTVSAGLLVGTTTSLQGTITNNAQVEFNQAAAGTYAGVMSGTGAFIKSGAGRLTLTGANTYTGGTTVSAGLLVGATTSLQGNIFNNALVEFNQNATGTYAGVMSGTGALTKTGTGTLTLSAPNTYTGGTTITGGVLQAGAAGVFAASGALSVGAGATLDLNGFDQTLGSLAGAGNVTLGTGVLTAGGNNASTLVSGAISGAGSLVKTGTGALTLTGANSYTGGTTVSGGSLVGNSTSLPGNIFNNALVVFDQNTNGLFAGVLSGTGQVTKAGPGTMTLVGSHPLTGGTTVSGGTLVLDGILGGSVSVGPGATFLSNGTVLGSVNVAGSLAAEAPAAALASLRSRSLGLSSMAAPGGRDLAPVEPLLTVAGDLTAIGGSIIALPVSEGSVPSILVGGRATLTGAHLDLTVGDLGNERWTSFLALTALNGLSVTNTEASAQSPDLIPSLSIDATSLYVTLLNYEVPLAGVATNPNAISAGQAIDRVKLGATGDGAVVVRELTVLDDRALDGALQMIAGEVHASAVHVSALDSEAFTDLVRDQIAGRDHDRRDGQTGWGGDRVQWWTQFSGMHATLDGNRGAHGGTVDLGGGAGGSTGGCPTAGSSAEAGDSARAAWGSAAWPRRPPTRRPTRSGTWGSSPGGSG